MTPRTAIIWLVVILLLFGLVFVPRCAGGGNASPQSSPDWTQAIGAVLGPLVDPVAAGEIRRGGGNVSTVRLQPGGVVGGIVSGVTVRASDRRARRLAVSLETGREVRIVVHHRDASGDDVDRSWTESVTVEALGRADDGEASAEILVYAAGANIDLINLDPAGPASVRLGPAESPATDG